MVAKPSPLSELCSALPSLPSRLQQVGRFVAANDYDATTRSMRDLATVAGADPAAFTRLAKAIGYSGWDELRAALTEARRPAQSSPFSGRAKGRRHGPNPEMSLVAAQARCRGRGPCAHLARRDRSRAPGRCMMRGGSGSRAFAAAAALPNCSTISFACSAPTRRNSSAAPAPRISTSARSAAGDAVVVIGFAPYSTASVLSARAAHDARATLIAIADKVSAPMAEGADHLLQFEAAASPGFFPSLTGAIAIAQSLAAATFMLGGASAKRRLEETEARLADTSQYVTEKG